MCSSHKSAAYTRLLASELAELHVHAVLSIHNLYADTLCLVRATYDRRGGSVIGGPKVEQMSQWRVLESCRPFARWLRL